MEEIESALKKVQNQVEKEQRKMLARMNKGQGALAPSAPAQSLLLLQLFEVAAALQKQSIRNILQAPPVSATLAEMNALESLAALFTYQQGGMKTSDNADVEAAFLSFLSLQPAKNNDMVLGTSISFERIRALVKSAKSVSWNDTAPSTQQVAEVKKEKESAPPLSGDKEGHSSSSSAQIASSDPKEKRRRNRKRSPTASKENAAVDNQLPADEPPRGDNARPSTGGARNQKDQAAAGREGSGNKNDNNKNRRHFGGRSRQGQGKRGENDNVVQVAH
jgi:hypothetical protein